MYNFVMDKSQDIHKYIWLEFAIWLIIAFFVIAGIRIHNFKEHKKLVTYQIFIPDVDGLIVGSPVKYMGVQIGYVSKIKIVSNEVYLKMVITEKDLKLPKGVIATVEFNGMGGSKSLEIYPPTKESLASGKLITVADPVRLHDAISLMSEMFGKIDSIISKVSFFAKETGTFDIDTSGLDLEQMQNNANMADQLIKVFNRGKNIDEKLERKSTNN